MKFRKKALAKLNQRDELDVPAELTRPRTWIALAVVAVLVVAGGIWAMTAELPRKVAASGILTHTEGSFSLQSPVSGQITGVFVNQGDTFPVDAPIFSVEVGNRVEVVKAITGGRITAMLGKIGQVISAGSELAVVERIDGKDDQLVAVLYVPATDAGQVRKDSQVDLVVHSAPAQEYGVLHGVVQSISQFAESQQQITEFLGDEQLGKQFSAKGQPLKVVVRLLPGQTASGYQWSTRSGPPYRIDSRTLVEGALHLPPIKPIDWVVL